jgi:dihydrofolate synthase/folylpolyglutamate synthase
LPPECFDVSLPGRHQAANAATVLATLDVLRSLRWNIPLAATQRALAGLFWPARVQVLSRRPVVVLDSAHNVASIQALVETLRESFAAARRFLIFATSRDKDVRGMLQCLLGYFDEVYFTRYRENSRAIPPEELQHEAEELTGRRRMAFSDPTSAWEAARQSATASDLVCITGSFFLAAELGPVVRDETVKPEI